MGEPIYRLPPDTSEPQALSTPLAETVDWGLAFANIPEHHKRTKGHGVRVAVLDTGIDDEHPDLADGIDAARDFTRSIVAHRDRNSHGTHVAGTIGARANGIGVIGVAPECRLLIAKVLGDSGGGDGAGVAAGVDWACEQGADIISMSLGSPQQDRRIALAIERATLAGKFVITAAGNDGQANSVNYPAKLAYTLAVAAFMKDGKLARFSSRGPEVDVAAPGQDILSTLPQRRYGLMSGTSMATPFVSGVVALMLAAHRAAEGAQTPLTNMAELREHVAKTALDAGVPGKDDEYGFGLINPDGLLAMQPPAEERKPAFTLAGVSVWIPAREGDLFSVGQ